MDFASEVYKMAGSLALVVVLMLGVLVVLKRFMGEGPTGIGGRVIRSLGGLRLGPGKSIVLVEVAGEVLVLGATSKELTLLTRIEDPHRVQQLRPVGGQKLPWWSRQASMEERHASIPVQVGSQSS
ncbi:MAG: flagellar biosynthetic protein FliO [Nitrospirae bacterium]|nr:flagellar biosynthetic protein FliO [Nitrospirota bacterium]